MVQENTHDIRMPTTNMALADNPMWTIHSSIPQLLCRDSSTFATVGS